MHFNAGASVPKLLERIVCEATTSVQFTLNQLFWFKIKIFKKLSKIYLQNASKFSILFKKATFSYKLKVSVRKSIR